MAFLTRPADTAWVRSSGLVDNLEAVAQRLDEEDKAHYITGVRASYSDPTAKGELSLEINGAEVLRTHVHGSANIEFDPPLKAPANAAVTARLTASGTAGVTGSVVLIGYTV